MLCNVSYNDPKLEKTIVELVGKPFGLKERLTMSGIGSPKMIISQASVEIQNLLELDHNQNSCNVELRPMGIIVRFRSLLETYALVIPFYKLNIFKGKATHYSLFGDAHKIEVESNEKVRKFFSKMTQLKAAQAQGPN
ncbi:MAG: hypothetical protein ACPF99_05900 [Flavobacteriaceae bacterium]